MVSCTHGTMCHVSRTSHAEVGDRTSKKRHAMMRHATHVAATAFYIVPVVHRRKYHVFTFTVPRFTGAICGGDVFYLLYSAFHNSSDAEKAFWTVSLRLHNHYIVCSYLIIVRNIMYNLESITVSILLRLHKVYDNYKRRKVI